MKVLKYSLFLILYILYTNTFVLGDQAAEDAKKEAAEQVRTFKIL